MSDQNSAVVKEVKEIKGWLNSPWDIVDATSILSQIMEIIPRLTSMTTLYLLSYLKALSDGVELTWLPTLIFNLCKENSR